MRWLIGLALARPSAPPDPMAPDGRPLPEDPEIARGAGRNGHRS